MLDFKRFLSEEKNLHLEHLEDELINNGSRGAREAILFAESLVKMLAGNSSKKYNITVKWDGAPAVFAGINPENGKFFVGSKSVFNVTPKINYTNADIDRNHTGGLAAKLKVALENLSKLGIKNVLQGDMMYSDDLSSDTIDGVNYITFTPNTITYAVPTDSDLAKRIVKAKMGIIFHTEYTGSDMQSMKASFGPDISYLKKTSSVWFDDATLKDNSGAATFTSKETEAVKKKLQKIRALMDRKTMNVLDKFLTDANMQLYIKTFYNTLVRQGSFGTPSAAYAGFKEWTEKKFDTDIAKMKSEKGKEKKLQAKKEIMSYIRSNSKPLLRMFAIHAALREVKMTLVRKIEQVKSIGLFLKTDSGFKVTAPEGFVAIDRLSNRAFKLVDRLNFSQANFNAAKNWEKG
tara:strand:+ start:730 stop:1944 length:1215 start_codon:yes stop_codon:yes gene_type:complete